MSKKSKKDRSTVAGWAWLIPIIIIITGIGLWLRGTAQRKSYPIAAEAQEFRLKVDEEMPTVEVGRGTRHRLWANKSYLAVSVQKDSSRITYSMPSGWETWNGNEPAGRLRLIGIEPSTLVKIVKVK